jgi:hypothetical protein
LFCHKKEKRKKKKSICFFHFDIKLKIKKQVSDNWIFLISFYQLLFPKKISCFLFLFFALEINSRKFLREEQREDGGVGTKPKSVDEHDGRVRFGGGIGNDGGGQRRAGIGRSAGPAFKQQ